MNDRVSSSKSRGRRQWAVRSIILLILTGALLIILLIWRRDTDSMTAALRAAQKTADAIQEHLKTTGLLPAALPTPSPTEFAYASYADRFYAQQTTRPAIIAASPTLTLMLRPDGCGVIIHEGGKIRVEWMTKGELSAAYEAQNRDAERFEQQRRARPPKLPS